MFCFLFFLKAEVRTGERGSLPGPAVALGSRLRGRRARHTEHAGRPCDDSLAGFRSPQSRIRSE